MNGISEHQIIQVMRLVPYATDVTEPLFGSFKGLSVLIS